MLFGSQTRIWVKTLAYLAILKTNQKAFRTMRMQFLSFKRKVVEVIALRSTLRFLSATLFLRGKLKLFRESLIGKFITS